MAESSVKTLIIYGDRAVGKSTLELNARMHSGASWCSTDNHALSSDGRIAFLGPTARRMADGSLRIRANGGAENLELLPDLPSSVEWVVASIPTSASDRRAFQIREALLQKYKPTVISLYSKSNQEFVNKRMTYFSGRTSIVKAKKTNAKKPPSLSWDDCHIFATEELHIALHNVLRILEIPFVGLVTEETVTSLEGFADLVKLSGSP